jgi:hypothetical protein
MIQSLAIFILPLEHSGRTFDACPKWEGLNPTTCTRGLGACTTNLLTVVIDDVSY